jgi:uncharacterized tellurite resistance protein B-like protein
MVGAMTPAEMRVLKSLVAVMWADGKVEGSESSVLEGLIAGFGASDQEEAEVLGWAKTPRSLDDVPLSELTQEDRELLLGNAALITLADGEQSASEKEILQRLVQLLGFSDAKAQEIIDSTRDGAIQLGTKPLEELPKPPPLRKKLPARSSLFCPQCGGPNASDALACSRCGFRLAEARQRLQSSPPPPPPLNPVPTPLPAQARHVFGTMLGVAVPAPGGVAPEGRSPSQPPPPQPSPSPAPVLRPSSRPPRFATMAGVGPSQLPAVQPDDLSAMLREALTRAYRSPAEIIAETTLRHGFAAVADRPFLEQELWAEFARDVRLLLCALEEGIPQRLIEQIHHLQGDDLRGHARQLAERRGLAEEAAEYAVAAWASALRGLVAPR